MVVPLEVVGPEVVLVYSVVVKGVVVVSASDAVVDVVDDVVLYSDVVVPKSSDVVVVVVVVVVYDVVVGVVVSGDVVVVVVLVVVYSVVVGSSVVVTYSSVHLSSENWWFFEILHPWKASHAILYLEEFVKNIFIFLSGKTCFFSLFNRNAGKVTKKSS